MEKPRGATIHTIEKGADVFPFGRWLRRHLRRGSSAKVMPMRRAGGTVSHLRRPLEDGHGPTVDQVSAAVALLASVVVDIGRSQSSAGAFDRSAQKERIDAALLLIKPKA